MGERGGRLKREVIYVQSWLICIVVWQKPAQHYKAIFLQLKIKFKKCIVQPPFTAEVKVNIFVASFTDEKLRLRDRVDIGSGVVHNRMEILL